MDDIKTAIAYAVNLLGAAIQAETEHPAPNGKTLAAMGLAEGTLRMASSVIDLYTLPGKPSYSVTAQIANEISNSPAHANWQRLAEAVVARRHWLSMSQPDVAKAGGPSEQTQRRIENAQRLKYKTIVFIRLETALRWPKGTVSRILDGTITNIDEVITAPWAPPQHGKETTP
jgi:hypothetical protein